MARRPYAGALVQLGSPLNAMKKTTTLCALLGAPVLLAAALPAYAALQGQPTHEAGQPATLETQKGGEQERPADSDDKEVVRILQTETREVAKDLYTIRWPRGKTVSFFVAEDGVLLIDTHLEQELYNIEAAIEKVTDKPIKYLVNTHWHPDHTSANFKWGADATIIAHENAKMRMEASDKIDGLKSVPPMTGDALPDVTIKDEMELEFGGQKIKIVHMYGGHTDGDIVVWFPALKVCITGDVFYSHDYPFVDTKSGGDPFQLLDVADKLDKLLPDDTTLVPGHGAPIEREALDEYRAMLEGTMLKVQEGIDRGLNVTGIMQEGMFDEYKERWDETGNKSRAWAFTLFQALKPS